jgi:hypothetical protein
MRVSISALMISVLTTSTVLTGGCVQMPTEKQDVADMRPSISFKPTSDDATQAKVFVDGIELGTVGDYLKNKDAVRILPGTHEIRVISNGEVLLSEKVYLSDGVNKTFIVN